MAKHEIHNRIPALRLPRRGTVFAGQALDLRNIPYSGLRLIPLSENEKYQNTWLWMKSQCDLQKCKETNSSDEWYTALQPDFVPDFETADWGDIAKLANGPIINTAQTESVTEFERRVRAFAAIMALPVIPSITNEDLIVITDIPAHVVIGYDAKSLTVAEDKTLLGLKEVPKGAHFVWAGSRDNSSRSGFWIITPYVGDLKDGNVVVKQWDVNLEALIRYVSFCLPSNW